MDPSVASDATTTPIPTTPNKDTPKTTRRRPIPRKGHTKSRTGCLMCKTRKVKCDESFPCCGPCTRLSLACRYSRTAAAGAAREEAEMRLNASLVARRPLQEEDTKFSIMDLRSFHNFLLAAYPSLPVDGAQIWQTVGQMSHNYVFLSHAMIALGASHLGICEGQSFVKDGLKHRLKAIKSLNDHWTRGCPVKADADAIFATMLILAFQTGYVPDGMTDHLAMTRGCYIIGHKFIRDSGGSIFNSMRSDIYITNSTKLSISQGSPDDVDQIESDFCESLGRIVSKCHSAAETEYVAILQNVANSVLSDSPESIFPLQPFPCEFSSVIYRRLGYRECSYMYEKLGEMSNEQFMSFIDPNNHAARLILLHLFFLDLEMSQKVIGYGRSNPSQFAQSRIDNWVSRKDVTMHWIQQIQAGLPEEHKPDGEWIAKRTRYRL